MSSASSKRARWLKTRTAAPSSPANDLGRSLRPRASAAKAESFAPSSSRKRLSTAPDGSQAKRQPAPPRVGMNPLPKVDALRHLIPDGKKLEVFCFGTGGSGELGFEVDDEVPTPRRQPWFNTALQNDSLGPRGLEDLVLGGMHALCRDSNGRVRLSFGRCKVKSTLIRRTGPVLRRQRWCGARSRDSRTGTRQGRPRSDANASALPF